MQNLSFECHSETCCTADCVFAHLENVEGLPPRQSKCASKRPLPTSEIVFSSKTTAPTSLAPLWLRIKVRSDSRYAHLLPFHAFVTCITPKRTTTSVIHAQHRQIRMSGDICSPVTQCKSSCMNAGVRILWQRARASRFVWERKLLQ